MAEQVIEIALPNNATALARVTHSETSGAEKASFPKFDFEGVSEALEGLAGSLKGALDSVAPDKVTIEFGLELAVKNGKLTALLVDGAGTASLSVALEWTRA